MITAENKVRRTNDTFYNQNSFLHSTYRPDHQVLMPHTEIAHSITIPPIYFDSSNEYQDQFKLRQLMLNQACLPLQSESSALCHILQTEEGINLRAQRQFVPTDKKDGPYWLKRCKNNDSARRSRFKRKCLDKILEKKLAVLQNENCRLKYELKICKQNSSDNTTNASATSTAESDNVSNAIGAYSYFHSEAAFPHRTFTTEAVKQTKRAHSSWDENDSSHSSLTYDSGEYPNSSSSPCYTSDEAWKLMCSAQSADGDSSPDSSMWASDLHQDNRRPTANVDMTLESLQFTEHVQKVPHKLRIKKNMHSIVEGSYVSDDKDPSHE